MENEQAKNENEPKSQSPQAQSQEPKTKPSIVESIREIERLYTFLNTKFKLGLDLNNLVVTIEETNANTLGFFRPSESPKSWYKDLAFKHQDETATENESKTATETETATEQDQSINHICLNSNHLRSKPYETATHEYAHFLNKVLDNYKGNNNNYHTSQFKARAEQLLLRVTKGTYGFNNTHETDEFKQMIEEEFKPSETAFLIFQETEQQRAVRLGIYPKDENGNPIIPTTPKPKGRLKKWVCDCGYIIRASENGKTPDKPLKAICGYCDSEFKIQEPSRAEPKPQEPKPSEDTSDEPSPSEQLTISIQDALNDANKKHEQKKAQDRADLLSEITEDKFKDYEQVRREGLINMFDIKGVCELSDDLNKEEVLKIMKNYDELSEVYKNGV